MGTDDLQLDIWKGDWGLPSIDQNCLTVLAYCKFSNVPVDVVKLNNPWISPNGNLPLLLYKKDGEIRTATKVSDILSQFRQKSYGTDFDLTSKQSADVMAYSSMIEEKLVPALLHSFWVDEKTYSEITRPIYGKFVSFPRSLYYPNRMRNEVEHRLNSTQGQISQEEQEAKIYKDAKECLNLLSTKLGKEKYFFGKTPSSLDAIVFGHLAPLLKAPLKNLTLQNHLKGCYNLCQFCNGIMSMYFPLSPEETEAERKKAQDSKPKDVQISDFPNKKRNIILAGIVALTAMVGYAIMSGLLPISFSHSSHDNHRIQSRPAKIPDFMQGPKFNDNDDEKEGDSEDKNEN